MIQFYFSEKGVWNEESILNKQEAIIVNKADKQITLYNNVFDFMRISDVADDSNQNSSIAVSQKWANDTVKEINGQIDTYYEDLTERIVDVSSSILIIDNYIENKIDSSIRNLETLTGTHTT